MTNNKTLWTALFTMLLWGSLFPAVKCGFSAYEAEGTADILVFAGIRFAVCGGVICLFSAVRDKKSYGPVRHSVFPILLSGVFAIILHYGFTYLGLERTDSSKAALLKQFGTLFYICFSFLFLREDRPTVRKVIASGVGFLGILALHIGPDGFSFSTGDFLILCASFCTVFSNVISKRVFEKVNPIPATGISQLFGGAVLLTAGRCMGGSVRFAPDISLWIMVYICVASVVSYCLWYGAVKKGELSRLFIIRFAEPVFACLFSALLLGENIWKIQYWIAFVLIGGGIGIAQTKSKKEHP